MWRRCDFKRLDWIRERKWRRASSEWLKQKLSAYNSMSFGDDTNKTEYMCCLRVLPAAKWLEILPMYTWTFLCTLEPKRQIDQIKSTNPYQPEERCTVMWRLNEKKNSLKSVDSGGINPPLSQFVALEGNQIRRTPIGIFRINQKIAFYRRGIMLMFEKKERFIA